MKDKTLIGGLVIMIIGALLVGMVWVLFLQPSRTPTAPLTAIPLIVEGDSSRYTFFEIIPAESEVTFTLNETLRGLPITVVGGSQNVVGQIAVDFANPIASQLGTILISARTLRTDNEFRNNAIHSFILDTEQYEFITFVPNRIRELPDQFMPDIPVSLQIDGVLTIRQVTQPITFKATITPNGRTELVGSATAQLERTDFNLQIPDAPGVANVSQEVMLTINFVAR